MAALLALDRKTICHKKSKRGKQQAADPLPITKYGWIYMKQTQNDNLTDYKSQVL
eukprot:COSAG06_NODE_62853_length_264_cov_0.545455_1_plen_54_part_10